MSGVLSAARYGKTLVRVFRVVREGSWHNIVEYNVEALLEGAIETRYFTQHLTSILTLTNSVTLKQITPL
jgi:urate oxidase